MNDVSDLIAEGAVSAVSPERFTPSPQVRGSMVNGETLLAFQSADNRPLTCDVSLFQVQPLRGGCTETAPAGGAATRRARRCYCGQTEAVRHYASGYRCSQHTPAALAGEPEPDQLLAEHRAAVGVLAAALDAEPVGTWPAGCGGPCARCGRRHHRYGPGGQPLCEQCRSAQ